MGKQWKICGINFDHMHMGDLLRMAHDHPEAEISGICDEFPERLQSVAENFSISPARIFSDYRKCLETCRPDLVILCPNTVQHADWVERVAPYGPHLLLEKPFAYNLSDADRILAALRPGQRLLVNWPLRWVASHVTARKLVEEGVIGRVVEVHYLDGNRGPLRHLAGKVEADAPGNKSQSWWYQPKHGGGSLLDYLGYGVTLGAWFDGGRVPEEVTCTIGGDPALEVDEHSITVCRYADGHLSKFETRWGTFTDPWTHQPTPQCGFALVGTKGTIASPDYAPTIRLQTLECLAGTEIPVVAIDPPFQNPVQYFLHCLKNQLDPEGPLSPELSRIGQQIVDAAMQSAREKRTILLK